MNIDFKMRCTCGREMTLVYISDNETELVCNHCNIREPGPHPKVLAYLGVSLNERKV